MTRFDFYHLQKSSLESVLPKLCEKVYATGQHTKILVGNAERIEFINSLLWTYNEESFLPHGSKNDGFIEDQPIFISSDEANENNASILILIDGANPGMQTLSAYERVLNIFDGNDASALDAARAYWKELKDSGHELHYWQQNDKGSFEQKL